MIISFFIFYGWVLLLLGIGSLLKNVWMISTATAVILFWAGPGTPLIPIILISALLIQRFIFLDKSNVKNLKKAILMFKNGLFDGVNWHSKEERKIFKKSKYYKMVKKARQYEYMQISSNLFDTDDDLEIKNLLNTEYLINLKNTQKKLYKIEKKKIIKKYYKDKKEIKNESKRN